MMTGNQLVAACERLGVQFLSRGRPTKGTNEVLTVPRFVQFLGVSLRQFHRWIAYQHKDARMPRSTELLLMLMIARKLSVTQVEKAMNHEWQHDDK